MARAVLASEMMQRVRYETDTENDTHVTDAEIYLHLTAAVAVTWEKIMAYGLGGEYVKKVTFTTAPGVTGYPVATVCPDGDFFKVKTMFVTGAGGLLRPVSRVAPQEEYGLKPPQTAVAMQLNYLPCAPKFVTGTESFDGINGWEEHSIQLACAAVKKKKNDDTSQYKSSAREVEERMKVHANRNADEPPRVIRRRASRDWANKVAPYSGEVYAWDLINGSIELFSPSYGIYR